MITEVRKNTVVIDGVITDYASFGNSFEKASGTSGEPEAPVVIIPGLSDGISTVRGKQILLSYYYRRLAKISRVIVISRRRDPPDPYPVTAMAADLGHVLDALEIKQALVIGISQGGMIGMELAAARPELIEKLLIVVSAPYANETVKSVVGSWKRMAEEGKYNEIARDTIAKTYNRKQAEKLLRLSKPFMPLMKPKSLERFIIQADACLTHDARPRLSGITAPTLVIGGAEDRVVGTDAGRETAEAIAGAGYIEYPGFGHNASDAPSFFRDSTEFME